MFSIRRHDGKHRSPFGWTPDQHAAFHYRTAQDAEQELAALVDTSGCTVEKVIPKAPPGVDPNGAAAIFGYGKAAGGG